MVLLAEFEGNMRDEVAILTFQLKHTLAITEATILACNFHKSRSCKVKSGYRFDGIFYFHTIRSDVLHGCGSDRTRNQREVFDASQIFLNARQNKRMPHFTGANF